MREWLTKTPILSSHSWRWPCFCQSNVTLFCDLISGYPNRLTRWERKMFYHHSSSWHVAGSSGSWTGSSWVSCPTARPRVPFPLPCQMICVTWTRGTEFNGGMIIIITLSLIFTADLLLSSSPQLSSLHVSDPSKLVLESVNRVFSGSFSCIGVNPAGRSSMSNSIKLKVGLLRIAATKKPCRLLLCSQYYRFGIHLVQPN